MDYMNLYEIWCEKVSEKELSDELASVKGNVSEIEDRFYRDLEFGTAGLRGTLGAGTNRMNVYTVCRSTQGLADYLNKHYSEASVAIAYDSRINGSLFAEQSAQVLAANGIKAYVYKELMPTPALSYAVRELGCKAGINVTASHNPAKYNGYKAYDHTGCQITAEMAQEVTANIANTDMFTGAKKISFEQGVAEGKIEYIDDSLVEKFINRVLEEQINPGVCKDAGLRLAYTPLNGAGRRSVLATLDAMGITDIHIVKEQEMPDGNFPTCPYPNPEIVEALKLGLELVCKVDADLLLATDPDCDRVAAAVMVNGEPRILTGNEMGLLIMDYIARSKIANGTMPPQPVVVKSIVSSPMAEVIAKEHGMTVVNVLTGFKYIGDFIATLEEQGKEENFLLGFEESCGYLPGGYVRDKDAVAGSMLICEMAAWYKAQNMHLGEAMDALYEKFGYYLAHVDSYTFEGSDGMHKMNDILASLREKPFVDIASSAVVTYNDYKTSSSVTAGVETVIDLPSANVLEYVLDDGSSVIVRPSGTEPKLKIYYSVKADSKQASLDRLAVLKEVLEETLGLK